MTAQENAAASAEAEVADPAAIHWAVLDDDGRGDGGAVGRSGAASDGVGAGDGGAARLGSGGGDVGGERRDCEVAGDVDLVVGAMALAHRTDREAETLLHGLAERARRAIVIEESRPDGLGPDQSEAALLRYATTGRPPRDQAEIARLAEKCGWRTTRVLSLGWGVEATFLDR